MRSTVRHAGIWRCANKATLLAAIGLSAGCATSLENHRAATRDIPTPAIAPPPNSIPVVRYARYTLIELDRKSTRLNSSHQIISYAVFCLKKKKNAKRYNGISYAMYSTCAA